MLRRHPVFTPCAAVSLLLCVAVVAGRLATWRLGHPVGVCKVTYDDVEMYHATVVLRIRWATINGGTLHVGRVNDMESARSIAAGLHLRPINPTGVPRFGVHRYPVRGDGVAGVPAWFAAIVLAMPPLLWLRGARLRGRRARWKATGLREVRLRYA